VAVAKITDDLHARKFEKHTTGEKERKNQFSKRKAAWQDQTFVQTNKHKLLS
jgi:hypothetical protein